MLTFEFKALLAFVLLVSPVLAEDPDETIKTAHAVLGSVAWVVFFPLGSIFIRLSRSSNAVWIHAAIQLFALCLVIANAGLGIRLALDKESLNEYHPIIGLVLFSVLFFQAAGGLIHHILYRKQGRRTIVTHAHIWLGRALITLGMINGGLGLLFSSDAERGEYIAYGVVAGIIWVVWIGIDISVSLKRSPEKTSIKQEKHRSLSDSTT